MRQPCRTIFYAIIMAKNFHLFIYNIRLRCWLHESHTINYCDATHIQQKAEQMNAFEYTKLMMVEAIYCSID